MADTLFGNIKTELGIEAYLGTDMLLDQAGSNLAIHPTDRNFYTNTGREFVFVFNSTGAPITLRITGFADAMGRLLTTAQSEYAIPAGDTIFFGRIGMEGFVDPANPGRTYLSASATGLRCCVFRLRS